MKVLGMITNMDPIYSNMSFAIMLLGIFSVFEITKTNQKLSLLKYYILARLIIVTAGSGLDYLGLIGRRHVQLFNRCYYAALRIARRYRKRCSP